MKFEVCTYIDEYYAHLKSFAYLGLSTVKYCSCPGQLTRFFFYDFFMTLNFRKCSLFLFNILFRNPFGYLFEVSQKYQSSYVCVKSSFYAHASQEPGGLGYFNYVVGSPKTNRSVLLTLGQLILLASKIRTKDETDSPRYNKQAILICSQNLANPPPHSVLHFGPFSPGPLHFSKTPPLVEID